MYSFKVHKAALSHIFKGADCVRYIKGEHQFGTDQTRCLCYAASTR